MTGATAMRNDRSLPFDPDVLTPQRLKSIAQALVALVILISVLVLVGWASGVAQLRSIWPGWPPMVPNTALGFLTAAISLLLLMGTAATQRFGRVLALLLLLASATVSAEWVLDANWGFRYWLFADALQHSEINRVAPGTALSFILLSILLALHGIASLRRPTEILLYALGILALMRFAAYPFGVVAFSALSGFRTMAALTSVCFILLWAALILLRGRTGVLGVLVSKHAGGRMARGLLLVALLVPFVNGWLRLRLELGGVVEPGEGAVLAAMINALMFTAFVIWAGHMLNAADAVREIKATELERSEARLRLLFDSPMLGVFYWNLDGRILDINDQFLAMLGYSRGDLTAGRLRWDELTPASGAEMDAAKAHDLATTGAMSPYEKEFIRSDGTLLPVLIGAAMLDMAQLEGVAYVTDITEQRRQREVIEERNAELTRINAELDSFSYSVSHDLRAPLRAIEGFSKALEEDYGKQLDTAAQRYIDRIRGGTIRMGQLIDDLLQLSRVSRAELNKVSLDFSELANQVARQLSEAEAGKLVEWAIAPDLTAVGDPRLLRIVLENLLGNAVKFTAFAPQPRIEIGHMMTPKGEAFFVRDNGAGFDMAYAGKLFVSFQRLHSNEKYSGTGIGLSIVRRIIARHGGDIWAESAPEQGATFYFTLGFGARDGN